MISFIWRQVIKALLNISGKLLITYSCFALLDVVPSRHSLLYPAAASPQNALLAGGEGLWVREMITIILNDPSWTATQKWFWQRVSLYIVVQLFNPFSPSFRKAQKSEKYAIEAWKTKKILVFCEIHFSLCKIGLFRVWDKHWRLWKRSVSSC